MNKIKEFIIHMLGGLTIDESVKSDSNCFDMGYFKAYYNIKAYADSLYGLPADEWCEKMYEHIEEKL